MGTYPDGVHRMNDKSGSTKTLATELAQLRKRVAELEASEPAYRRAQQKVEHLNLVLRAIRSVNQLVAREKDRDRLLRSVCDCLIEARRYHNAWIALLDEDGGLVTTAEAGLGSRFRPMVERLKHGQPTACARQALAQPGPVITTDPALTCTDCPLAAQYGEQGAMTARLEHAGTTYGLLSVSTPAHLAVDEEECTLFEEVAGDIAFALHGIELEKTRRRANETIRALLNAPTEGAMLIDMDGMILAANEAIARSLEHSPDDLLGVCVYDLLPPEVARSRKARVAEVVASRKPVRFEDARAGRTLDNHIYPVFDEHGNVISLAVYARDFTDQVLAEERLRNHVADLEFLSGTAMALVEYTSNGDIYRFIANRLRELSGDSTVAVSLYDKPSDSLEIRAVAGLGKRAEKLFRILGRDLVGMRYPVTDAEAKRALLSGELMDGPQDLHEISFGVLPKGVARMLERFIGLGATYVIGFVSKGELFGSALILTRKGTKPRDRSTIHTFVHQAAVALQRQQAEERLQRYADRLSTLRAIDAAILAAWSPQEIGQAALQHIRQLVPCRGAGIVTFDLKNQEVIVVATENDGQFEVVPGMRLPLEGGTEVIETLRQGQVLVEENSSAIPRPPSAIQALQAAGLSTHVAVPLIARDELIGALRLALESPDALAPEHMDIAKEVADQLAVALHQAHLRAALEAEQKRLDALVKHLPEGVLLLDRERRILLANAAAESILPALTDAAVDDVLTHLANRPAEELLQPPPRGLWHTVETPGPPHRIFEIAARPVKTEAADAADRRRSGSMSAMSADARTDAGSMSASSRASQDTHGWVLLMRDTTEERHAQQRIQHQERLAAVGQLAGGIAHDFNNLLTTIMLHAQLLLRGHDLPKPVTSGLNTIVGEARQASRLVGQVLDFSRRAPIETHPLDLNPFIDESMRMLQRTIPESISLHLEAGEEAHTVCADPTRIQQVVMNLAINARDAMPKGGELHIKLSKVHVAPGEKPPLADMVPGEWVCLAVSDTGTGIAPEVLPHIFEPFFTTKQRGQGTGLGLAQVYGIVMQHGGHIGVETEAGHGTTFRVYLPAHRERIEETRVEPPPLAAPRGHGEVILLVEDNETIREAGRRFLETFGYRVLTAADGREALDLYRSADPVDLVVTDMVMPEMGGRELVQEMRLTSPDLKAVVITGYALEEDLGELKEEGILAIIQKPFDIEVLADAIRQALDTT